MNKYSEEYLPFQRSNSTIDLRQYLLPPDTDQNQSKWLTINTLHPNILAAIGDASLQLRAPTIQQRLISLYKKVGGTLRPDNPYMLIWNVLLVLIIIYFIIQLGLIFAFGEQFWADQMSVLVGLQIFFLVVLAIDIVISPLKEYYAQGLLIKDVPLILRNYVRMEFWFDILSFLSILLPLVGGNVNINWLKVFWFLKLYSLGNIFDEIQRITQLSLVRNTFFLILKLFIYAYFYAHFMGIIFYKISNYLYETNYYGPRTPNIVWVYNSWAFYQLIFLPWYQIYLYTMYFSLAVVTTIAYGDITPKNPIECGYMIMQSAFQTLIWGYILSSILRLLINIYNYNFQRKFHHFALNFKLKANLISNKTFQKIQKHTEQIDRDEQYRNRQVQQKFLNLLPPDPLYGMLLLIYSQFLQSIGFSFVSRLSYKSLGSTDQKSIFLEQFMRKIKQTRHFAGDILYIEEEEEGFKNGNHCAYCFTDTSYAESVILGLGEPLSLNNFDDAVQIQNANQKSSFELKKPQKHFGQTQFLTGGRRSHWAVCLKNCLLFVIPRSILRQNYGLLTLQQKEIIALHTQKVDQLSCLVCRQQHNFKSCPYVFVQPFELKDTNSKAFRSKTSRINQRARLKTLSSWQLYSSIRYVKIKVTARYAEQLLYDKSAQQLFVALQLEENQEEKNEQKEALQQEIFTTQIILENIYHKELGQLCLSEQPVSYDTACNFTHYKPQNNIEQVALEFQKSRKNRRRRKPY